MYVYQAKSDENKHPIESANHTNYRTNELSSDEFDNKAFLQCIFSTSQKIFDFCPFWHEVILKAWLYLRLLLLSVHNAHLFSAQFVRFCCLYWEHFKPSTVFRTTIILFLKPQQSFK